MNPHFIVQPPIPNATKNKIYQMHMKDRKAYSLRMLAQQFNISLLRAEAVIKLKSIEASMVAKVTISGAKGFRIRVFRVILVLAWISF